MKRILSLLLALVLAVPSLAAERPLVIQSGQVKKLPSATSLQLNAPTTGSATVNLPHGTAPTSPADGDCWTTTAGLYCRISGATVGPYGQSAAIAADSLVGNFTGSSASPTSQALPSCSGSNDALYYDTTTHTIGCHAPSGAGGGTVTSIATSGLVTGGTITGSGTISLSSISAGYVVGNATGSSAVPTASTLSALIDQAIGGTQGQILYRGASAWSALSPGSSGYVLTSGGASANPSWAASNSGLISGLTLPALSGFTQVNISGNFSVTEYSGKAFSIVDASPTTGAKVAGVAKAAPSTPYRVAVLMQNNLPGVQYLGPTFGFRKSDGSLHILGVVPARPTYVTNAYEIMTFSNPTTRASTTAIGSMVNSPHMGQVWLGLRDDGTNVYWETSTDGVNFTILYKIAKSSGYLGSSGYNQVFVGLYSESDGSHSGTDWAWSTSIRTWDESGLSRTF